LKYKSLELNNIDITRKKRERAVAQQLAAPPFEIRDATPDDVPAIANIWRKGLAVSLGFDAEFLEAESYFARCVSMQSKAFKFWVVTDDAGKILGWESLLPSRANPIMRNFFAEVSTYVDPLCGVHHLGTALIKRATEHADNSSLQYITGIVSTSNGLICHILSKAGFIEVGRIPRSTKEPVAPEAIFFVYVAKGAA
jgi:L-amino acid N-acyltransferase YncA